MCFISHTKKFLALFTSLLTSFSISFYFCFCLRTTQASNLYCKQLFTNFLFILTWLWISPNHRSFQLNHLQTFPRLIENCPYIDDCRKWSTLQSLWTLLYFIDPNITKTSKTFIIRTFSSPSINYEQYIFSYFLVYFGYSAWNWSL